MANSRKKTLKPSEKNAGAKLTNGALHAAEFNVGSSLRYTFRFMYQSLQGFLEPHNVPSGMFYFLLTLWKGDGLTQRELSERVGIMGPGTVEQLRRMEKRGLIKRVPSLKDRRKIHVYLTPKGRALKNELLPLARRSNAIALEGFTATEAKQLRSYLGRIRENMNAAKETNGRKTNKKVVGVRAISSLHWNA